VKGIMSRVTPDPTKPSPLDFDLASIQVEKSSFDISQVLDHSLNLRISRFKFFMEIRVRRIQELHIIQFVQVQDELTDVLEARLRPAFEKGSDFRLRVGFGLHLHSPSDAT
jgi:hypothetical protein